MELYDPAVFARIQEKLSEMEEKEQIRILHCVESGSRAWGFASPDSDYDVRFFYVRRPEFYLRLEKTRDVIEWELNDVYDINGWDFQKMLRLLHKSNPTIFEWNGSPIIYKTTPEWTQVQAVINKYFLSKSGLYHYLSSAKSNYREYLKGDTVRLKKYFYVLRPILACRWILDKGSPPPMLFSELAEAELDTAMKPIVEELLSLKKQSPELGTGQRIDALNCYLDEEIDSISQAIMLLPEQQQNGWDTLNDLFLRIIKS